jgi:hypothetical protein
MLMIVREFLLLKSRVVTKVLNGCRNLDELLQNIFYDLGMIRIHFRSN